jgi:Domain of Unknown Function with PDB structure (DUF3857)/Domain of Unknown Function with PDB structure (DUF3858)
LISLTSFILKQILFFTIVIFYSVKIASANNIAIANIPTNLLANANSIMRHQDLRIEINSISEIVINHTQTITFLNKAGLQHFAPYEGYDKNTTIKEMQLIVYDAVGKEIDNYKKSKFIDQSASGDGTLVGDYRVKFLILKEYTFPFTIEFLSTIKTSNTAFIPTFAILSDYNMAVQQSTWALINNSILKINYKEYNFEQFAIQKKSDAVQWSYEIENINAMEEENFSQIGNLPFVDFMATEFELCNEKGNFANWNEYGIWTYNTFLKQNNTVAQNVVAEIAKLVSDEKTRKDSIYKIYEYLQNTQRYVSIQLGIGGWKPFSPQFVHDKKYGDCKALANYTRVILETQGIASYYAIIHAGKSIKKFDESFPKFSGNHIILCVPNEKDTIWLECTSAFTAFDYNGLFTGNRNALIVSNDGGKIVNTHQYNQNNNFQNQYCEIILDSSGNINCDWNWQFSGIYFDEFDDWVKYNEKEKEEKILNYCNQIANIEVSDIDVVIDKKIATTNIKSKVSATHYVKTIGGNLLIKALPINSQSNIEKLITPRKFAIEIQNGYTKIISCNIHFPKNFNLENEMPTLDLSNEFGSYIISFKKINDTCIHVNRKFVLNKGIYKKENYNLLYELFSFANKKDNSPLLFTKK